MADDLTDEEIEWKFTAMGHSVTEFNEIITEEQPTEYIRGRHPTHLERHNNDPEMLKEVVARDVRFIEHQQAKDWYKKSSNSKTAYDNAVTAGKNFVGS